MWAITQRARAGAVLPSCRALRSYDRQENSTSRLERRGEALGKRTSKRTEGQRSSCGAQNSEEHKEEKGSAEKREAQSGSARRKVEARGRRRVDRAARRRIAPRPHRGGKRLRQHRDRLEMRKLLSRMRSRVRRWFSDRVTACSQPGRRKPVAVGPPSTSSSA